MQLRRDRDPVNGLEDLMGGKRALKPLKRKWGKFTSHLVALLGFAVGLMFPPPGSTAATPETAIRAEIDRFVQGLQQKNTDKVAGVFKPDALWLGRNIHQRMQVSAAAMFDNWDHIRVRVDNVSVTPHEDHMKSRVMLNLKARMKNSGSPVEKNLDLRWLWQKTPEGWLVIADESRPGPALPEPPPPPLTGAHGKVGMPISVEVIGFGIKSGSKEEKQLREVAHKGGGGYRPAANADELIEALEATVEESIQRITPPPKPRPSPTDNGWQPIGGSNAAISSEGSTDQSLRDTGRQAAPSRPNQEGGWEAIGSGNRDSKGY
jgi:ketosteroid isomerase-like protein